MDRVQARVVQSLADGLHAGYMDGTYPWNSALVSPSERARLDTAAGDVKALLLALVRGEAVVVARSAFEALSAQTGRDPLRSIYLRNILAGGAQYQARRR